ncbi:MAG TPA: CaiB/BaiF CoA-transferase family protein [Roseiflexaceae bacterium]|nr:CaiB/BaiF CoA-transferase family protein [Roseiflexaceae bacterium]
MDDTTPPLAGVRVLDLSRLIPGPYATLLLAALGAEVIKVEPPGEGDYLRLLPPHGPDGMNAAFTALNRGKRSVALDLRAAGGPEALRQLAARADVLVEGFRPGVLARLGVAPEALRRANARLITCSVGGYAPNGPHASRAGHDLTYQARAGALALHSVGEAPGLPVLPLADLAAGLFAAQGVLVALLARAASGRGRHVAVSLEESVGALLLLERADAGAPVRFSDQLRGARAGYRVYRCGDGRRLALGALEPKFWRALCRTLGREAWAERWAEADQGALAGELATLLATRPAAEWEALLHAADVPCDLVRELEEARAYPPLPYALGGGLPPDAPAPRHGADTAAVLGEAGFGPAELAALRATGAIS